MQYICRWSCSSCSKGALYRTFFYFVNLLNAAFPVFHKDNKSGLKTKLHGPTSNAFVQRIKVCCPGRKTKDKVELWHILFQWAHPNTDKTHSVTTEGLGGWRGTVWEGEGGEKGCFWITGLEHLMKGRGGGRKWQQGLDIQHLRGVLGHAEVRWGTGFMVVYNESWEAANHSVISQPITTRHIIIHFYVMSYSSPALKFLFCSAHAARWTSDIWDNPPIDANICTQRVVKKWNHDLLLMTYLNLQWHYMIHFLIRKLHVIPFHYPITYITFQEVVLVYRSDGDRLP